MPEPWIMIGAVILIIIVAIVIFIVKKNNNGDDDDDYIYNGDYDVKINPDTLDRAPRKKALLVGINKYMSENNLSGCVNDVETMYDLLINQFKFDPANIRVLVDERATKKGILERLEWLLDKYKIGDELVFHYSGHGSQIRDRDSDELDDQLDEILCPHDLNWDDPLTDDYLGSLFKQIPEGVYLTMLCDSCHSGTIAKNISNTHPTRSKSILPPFDIRSRSLHRILPKNKMGRKNKDIATQRHVLVSGCKDNQTSSDAYINGKYQGAFTWALTTYIRSNHDTTWHQAHVETVKLLSEYTQEPQLSGNIDLTSRKVFGG
jgi:hypothetical protein